jgi:hypothetical protein
MSQPGCCAVLLPLPSVPNTLSQTRNPNNHHCLGNFTTLNCPVTSNRPQELPLLQPFPLFHQTDFPPLAPNFPLVSSCRHTTTKHPLLLLYIGYFVVWSRSKQQSRSQLFTTVASTRKRKAAFEQADILEPTLPAAKRLATPVGDFTPSVTTAMSSDEDFMSDQMSDDGFDDDSLGELGRGLHHPVVLL